MEHKLIKTENYLFVVSDEDRKRGWFYCVRRKSFFHDEGEDVLCCNGDLAVEAHLPLNNSPIIQGVDLLPALEQDNIYQKFQEDAFDIAVDDFRPYKAGYNKAKEKFCYTKEELIWAIQEAYGHGQNDEFDGVFHLAESIDAITKHLSQPKLPVAFKCEMKKPSISSIPHITNFFGERVLFYTKKIPKTTTNSQGQTVWVGEYKF